MNSSNTPGMGLMMGPGVTPSYSGVRG